MNSEELKDSKAPVLSRKNKARIAIVDGIRTPFCKSWGQLKDVDADDLAAYVLKEVMARTGLDPSLLDEVIVGNCSQPVDAANMARVSALKAGLPDNVPAFTVQRNCASGMQSVASAADKILSGHAEVILAAGAESMSNIPFIYGPKMTAFFQKLSRAKSFSATLSTLLSFRPSFLKPIIGLEKGLTDPIPDMIMGKTAEILAREFLISREQQDRFSLRSHQKAKVAITSGRLSEETLPIPAPPDYKTVVNVDDGPRSNQSIEALQKLKPFFDKVNGSVTAGSSSQVTDGAAAVLLMREDRAKALGFEPLGYLRDYAFASLDGVHMGLGPVYATAKLLDRTGMKLQDFKLVEINEAFAAQVLACQEAFESEFYAKRYLGRSSALGSISDDILNVNGGGVALGHPVGATGTRLIITLLKELRRRNEDVGLATLCVGGGQGAAFALEVA